MTTEARPDLEAAARARAHALLGYGAWSSCRDAGCPVERAHACTAVAALIRAGEAEREALQRERDEARRDAKMWQRIHLDDHAEDDEGAEPLAVRLEEKRQEARSLSAQLNTALAERDTALADLAAARAELEEARAENRVRASLTRGALRLSQENLSEASALLTRAENAEADLAALRRRVGEACKEDDATVRLLRAVSPNSVEIHILSVLDLARAAAGEMRDLLARTLEVYENRAPVAELEAEIREALARFKEPTP